MRNRPLGDGIANVSGNRIGVSIVIAVFLLLLAAAGVIGYLGWTTSNADVPTSGYVAMALGVVFSLAVGVGLMALVFYSSRKGFDEPATLIRDPDETNELETHPEQKR
jgi:hypothetical protein